MAANKKIGTYDVIGGYLEVTATKNKDGEWLSVLWYKADDGSCTIRLGQNPLGEQIGKFIEDCQTKMYVVLAGMTEQDAYSAIEDGYWYSGERSEFFVDEGRRQQ